MEDSVRTIGLGVIGVGDFGQNHAHVWRDLPGASLVAVADLDPVRARAVAERYGARRWYTNHAELLADPEVEAVSICTLDDHHREPAVAAARAGIHILLEKPIASTLEDAEAITAATRAAGVVLQVGHLLRFDARYVAIKERLEAGDLGPLIQMVARRQGRIPHAQQYGDRVSPMLINGIHDADLLLWYAQEPVVEVLARAVSAFGKRYPDVGWTLLRFRSGALGVMESGWVMPAGHPTFQLRMEVFGRNGAAFLDKTSPLLTFSTAEHTVAPETHYQYPVRGELWGALRHQCEHFLDCVRTGRPPAIVPEEATAALRVVLAAMESAKTGHPVRLDG